MSWVAAGGGEESFSLPEIMLIFLSEAEGSVDNQLLLC